MTIGHVLEPRPKELRGDPNLVRMTDDRLLGLFIERGDEGAFEAIVARHAPRVLGVCRQVLRGPHDVEDVFQSTFLLLARNAAKIRRRESLGHWLHGVAHRLSVRSKLRLSRRSAVEGERQGVAMAAQQPDDVDRRDLRRVVHEEVDRLPERLRQPILLCYLEGITNEAAARRLGCPPGTLKVRLAKARAVLHGRLARRGIALSATLLLLMLPQTAPAADVPRRLVLSTVLAAMADERKRRCPAPSADSLEGSPASVPPRTAGRAVAVAVALVTAGAFTTALLYLATPEPDGFLSWLLGAVRRSCH